VLAALALTSHAELIDFESGFVDQQQVVNPIALSYGNTLTFGVGTSSLSQTDAYIAKAGGNTTAYVPNDQIPVAASGGEYFLTDEFDGPSLALNYYMEFLNPVRDLSLDLYDSRMDGGAQNSNDPYVTVSVFSDTDYTDLISAVQLAPPDTRTDPNLLSFYFNGIVGIQSASVVFGHTDVGTGIDNIRFTTVPEPTSISLLLFGLAGLYCFKRKESH